MLMRDRRFSLTARRLIRGAFGRAEDALPIIVLAELVGVMIKRRVNFDYESVLLIVFTDWLPIATL